MYNFNSTDVCGSLDLGGYSDWRLPKVKELESITDDTRYDPAIDTNFFSNAHSSNYWSTTTIANDPYNARAVLFYDGYVSSFHKSYNQYVRCVRGEQSALIQPTKIGIFDHGTWYLDSNQSWAWEGTPSDTLGVFGIGLTGEILLPFLFKVLLAMQDE